ncbi:lysophospholipid acyltransferase family protein [Nocardioides sp. GY 10127]|uniref:lysophospholipid acyltransferase family protein n=1 Tax=Nocardioides sp. GY 10127 TaxID=2569762 RepID=UPI0010A82C50|nr:lysophospholipid acyltransferase family protein [Nocardioides sp. GY 10127]TIC80816.1 1-acyl-sn-glycerol-3-phosphate acyltransferase [Nocardioides sp. GY 10127]
MTVRSLQQPRGWAWTIAVVILKPLLLLLTRRDWRHGERIPATGGVVLAVNHTSHVDPLTTAHLVYDHGRLGRFLAKSGLFRNRFLGFFLRAAGQIPVEREGQGQLAYAAAVEAVRRGECVVVYPEGTITRDPGLWPMTGKSGAARIGLETGCPVLPVGQWGAHLLLGPYASRPDLWPPKTIHVSVGEPVDLSDLRERGLTPETVQAGTERIQAAIVAEVEALRGETAPTERFDLRRARAAERAAREAQEAAEQGQDSSTTIDEEGRA